MKNRLKKLLEGVENSSYSLDDAVHPLDKHEAINLVFMGQLRAVGSNEACKNNGLCNNNSSCSGNGTCTDNKACFSS
jgi:hypothetical protein